MSNGNKKKHLQSQVINVLKPNQYEIDDEQSLAKLKNELLAAQKKLTKYQSQAHNATQMLEESETDENQLTQTAAPEDDDDDGMYGADYNEKMVCIGNNVYCRKNIHDMAFGSSHLASHVARKLLDGVFKLDFLVQSTLTGQTPRAQGQKLEPVSPLNIVARKAIIDYAMNVAKDRGWVQQPTDKIQRAMTQRIGELKRQKRAQ